ncbi:MAG: bifunctional nicotinamidase/pyrazinamidase [Saprospiraceae bacterium]|nr:bifunctional nicotinamidase/pyrazinamidase [Saprospiraceae bacterium]
MKALLLIDLQIDFLPGGALEVKEGDQVIPIANQLMQHFDLVVATKDWHPPNHGSFAANHPWRKPGQVIDLNGLEQILWNIHCVQNTFGAEFATKLNDSGIHHIIYKGTDAEIDSYSGFHDNGYRKSTGLTEFLKEKGVEEVYIMGLATDFCVKFSVLDAIKEGFRTNVVVDGCRGVNLAADASAKALEEMKAKGARLIQSAEAIS